MVDESATSELTDPLVGTIVAERYRVDRRLGEGAMGAVYQAEHVHMQKAVALKVLHRETSENSEVVTRFEREAIAAGRIAHPHVAGATDFGRLGDGSFYLVLEFVAGKSLGEAIAQVGVMPTERACAIGFQIASALAAAHATGIVHRDLKPENVMLLDGNRPGGPAATALPLSNAAESQDFVKVLDFGLAKLNQTDPADTKLTMVGAVYGTPQYMAPEQAAGNEVDHRADLYALGLILYEMVAGHPPFSSEQMMPLLIKHMTEPPPPLHEGVPRPLARLIGKLLSKKPEDRHQSAEEVLRELDELTKPAPRNTMATLPEVAARLTDFSKVARERSKPLLASLRAAAKQAWQWLSVRQSLAGRAVPRWALVGAGLALMAVLFLVLSPADTGQDSGVDVASIGESEPGEEGEASSEPQEAPERKPERLDPQLLKVIESAERGSDSALFALQQRDPEQRTVSEWMALSKGHLMRKQVDESLQAFEKAIEVDPAVRGDKALLGALRRLADEPEHAKPILQFAAEHLEQIAPDLLFDVWYRTSAKTLATSTAYDLLTEPEMREHMSPALKVALALRDAESCQDFQRVLPKVVKYGDERAINVLRKLTKRDGCGPRGKEDCYECLRGDDSELLNEAIQQATLRKAPRFPLLRRWRWR